MLSFQTMTGDLLSVRPVIKCPTDGWYVESDAQRILNWQTPHGDPAECRHCKALVPWEPSQLVVDGIAPHDCPPCPEEKCQARMGTPAHTTERGRWYGPADATLWCPACGSGWVGTPAEVAWAESAWRAYLKMQA